VPRRVELLVYWPPIAAMAPAFLIFMMIPSPALPRRETLVTLQWPISSGILFVWHVSLAVYAVVAGWSPVPSTRCWRGAGHGPE